MCPLVSSKVDASDITSLASRPILALCAPQATEVQSAWIRITNEAIDALPRYCRGELGAMSVEERAAAEFAAKGEVT